MDKDLRNKAIELRLNQRMSYGEIRQKLGVSKSTLSYWLREYPLTESEILKKRRAGWEKGEVSRERFRNTMRNKRRQREEEMYKAAVKKFSKLSAQSKYIAGLILYVAEGNKKDLYKISLANTDPAIIKFYMHWITSYFGVPKEQLRFQLHLYEGMDLQKETNFWRKELGIEKDQLYKTQVRKLQKNSFTYRESYRHGTCGVHVSDGKKKMQLMQEIRAFFDLHSK